MTNLVFTTTLQLILAAFNQFAERAELDIQLPIQQEDITQIKIRERPYGWCFMIVGDRHRFNWTIIGNPGDMRGRINYDDLKYSTPRIDRQTFLPSLTNVPSLITTNEALKIAERCLHRLGYGEKKQYRLPPLIAQFTHQNGPQDVPKPVPLYGIRWLPMEEDAWESYIFEIEVSGITKKVTRLGQLTFEGNIVDLRQFLTNGMPGSQAETNTVSTDTGGP
jgi:hypothetical protein